LIPFHAGYNRSNPSFFQITNRFDRTHGVKTGKAQGEHMFSAVHPITDFAKILRHFRFVPSADLLNHLGGDSPDQTRLLMFSVAD
jgi:hypothetical protein